VYIEVFEVLPVQVSSYLKRLHFSLVSVLEYVG